jgi:hypothetical protein
MSGSQNAKLRGDRRMSAFAPKADISRFMSTRPKSDASRAAHPPIAPKARSNHPARQLSVSESPFLFPANHDSGGVSPHIFRICQQAFGKLFNINDSAPVRVRICARLQGRCVTLSDATKATRATAQGPTAASPPAGHRSGPPVGCCAANAAPCPGAVRPLEAKAPSIIAHSPAAKC